MTAKSLLLIGAALVTAILISYAATPFFIRLARRIGWLDVPRDTRRMHHHPIPLLGGFSIILAFFAVAGVSAAVLFARREPLLSHMLLQLLPGSLIIAFMAFWDDRYDLPPLPRLFIQCGAAGLTVAMGVRITFISASVRIFGKQTFNLGDLSIPITILWIVGITNAMNWIDGLDGLAAGISSIASLSILAISVLQSHPQVGVAVLTAALAGGCLGLLPYNRHPARVFMGDTGAMFLGFVLSVVSIQGLFKFYAAISFAVPLLVLGLPLLDTISAIFRRIAEKKSPFAADRSHIHHKLIDLGLSQKQAVLLLDTTSIVLGILGVIFTVFNTIIGWRFSVVSVLLVIAVFWSLLTIFRRRNIRTQNGTGEAEDACPPPEDDGNADGSAAADAETAAHRDVMPPDGADSAGPPVPPDDSDPPKSDAGKNP